MIPHLLNYEGPITRISSAGDSNALLAGDIILQPRNYLCRMEQHPVVLFDGVCNFCNYWVRFAIKRDRKSKLRFTPLQGRTATSLLPPYSLYPTEHDSVILIDQGKAYTQSSAALRICKYLDGGWKLFYGLMIIPKFIRDFFYHIIARNRYKWYGKKDACMVPSADVKARFLD